MYQLLHRHLERCLVIASEEYQELTIKAPPLLFSDSGGKPARYVRLMKSFYGLTSALRAWWLDITQKLSQFGWKSMSTDQCLWCRYSDDGELKGSSGYMLTISFLVWQMGYWVRNGCPR